jgi:hypothetical protein
MFSNGGMRSGSAARTLAACLTLPSAIVQVRTQPAACISGLRGVRQWSGEHICSQLRHARYWRRLWSACSMSPCADLDPKQSGRCLGLSFRKVFCIATLLDCTRFNLESRPGIEVFDRRGFRSRDEDMGAHSAPVVAPAPLHHWPAPRKGWHLAFSRKPGRRLP